MTTRRHDELTEWEREQIPHPLDRPLGFDVVETPHTRALYERAAASRIKAILSKWLLPDQCDPVLAFYVSNSVRLADIQEYERTWNRNCSIVDYCWRITDSMKDPTLRYLVVHVNYDVYRPHYNRLIATEIANLMYKDLGETNRIFVQFSPDTYTVVHSIDRNEASASWDKLPVDLSDLVPMTVQCKISAREMDLFGHVYLHVIVS